MISHHLPAQSIRVIRSTALASLVLGLLTLGACSGDTTSIGPSVDIEEALDVIALPDVASDLVEGPEVVSFDSSSPDGSPDTTPADTSVEPNCNVAPYDFFCPCDINTQCASGYCIQAGDNQAGMRCSQACQEECPNGWECRGLSAGGDPIFVCQPPINTLCDACERDADCRLVGAKCVPYEDGDYCGTQCNSAADCPNGYACEDVLNDLGQVIATQCLRSSGSCNCPDGTDYNSDPDNCGVCGHVCSYTGAQALCNVGECALGPCVGANVNLNGLANDGCEYPCAYVSADDEPDAVCNGSSCDQNCDGIDGSYDLGIFVSETGSSRGDGSATSPLNAIPAGIALAKSSGKPHVYVSAGTYAGEVIMQEGVSIFGGYSNDGLWRRNLSQYRSILTNSSGTNSIRVVIADNLGAAGRTVLDGFDVQAGNNVNAGGSSYAIWMRNVGANVVVRNVNAIGGNGGAGTSGSNGNQGADGVVGQKGEATNTDDCRDYRCNEFSQYGGDGGNPGTSQCQGSPNAEGGKGGDSGCGEDSDDPPAKKGANSPGGALGGVAPGASTIGNNGASGASGSPAAHGAAGLGAGVVSGSGFWSGNSGSNGVLGQNGIGGGGGSGGGGDNNGWSENPSWGGGGGGGGSGGCGGSFGTSGSAGGGSFGLFVYNSSPTLQNSRFGHRNGGNGGRGGTGAPGGLGKDGGLGGAGCDDAEAGGKGGKGGDGGRGGNGGGGAGGIAYGMYVAGTSSPSCVDVRYDLSSGTGGLGGAGGDNIAGQPNGNAGAGGAEGDRNGNFGTCR